MSELTDHLRKNYPAGAHHLGDWGTCDCCGDDWPCEWGETFADIHTAANEIERLRSELKAIEQLADPLGPSPGDLIRLLGRMAAKALR